MDLNQSLIFFKQSSSFQAGFTTRQGGMNQLWGLNLGLNTQQDLREVEKNRLQFAELLGKQYDYAFANQVHSSEIAVIDKGGIYDGVDGFVTSRAGLVLNILTADCLGIAAVDEKNQVAGAFHAGWKGTAGKIVQKGIEKMISLGAVLSDIEVFIGPGIKVNDYEVGEDLKKYFPQKVFETHNGKFCLNLEAENKRQLEEMGIQKITTTPYSTFQEENLYSYRKGGNKAGRFATFVVMG